MSEDLELKVKADTGEAVANLQKTEKAVDGVTKATDRLDTSAKKASKSLNDAGAAGKKSGVELGGVADGLNKTTGGFAKLLESTGKVSLIFGAAVAAGKLLSTALVSLVDSSSKAAEAQQRAAERAIKFEAALRLAKDGTIALGRSTEEMLANYDAYAEKMRAARISTDETTEALKRQKQAFDELQAGLPDIQKRTSFTILSPEDAAKQLDSVKALAEGLNNAFEKAFQAGGEGERDKWVAANEEAVKKVTEAYQKAGLELPAHLKTIAQAHDDSADKAMEWASAQAAAYDRVAAAADRSRGAEEARSNRTSKAPEEFRQIQFEAIGAAAAMGQLGTNLDNVADVVVATGGTMTVGAPYFIQYAQATREATQALLDFAVASKAVREEQATAMEITKGWTDYILTLKDGYESGITSLYNYVTALGAFKTQLQQMFSSAHGEAKDALEGMIQLIEKLMQTAGAGQNGQFGTPDFSPAAQLERAFRKRNG